MKITPHFSLAEFACRDGTPYPSRWINARLRPLCDTLEVIRAEAGSPVRVLSGYRTPRYNARIGGARKSEHMEGCAGDIIADGMSAASLHALVLRLYRDGRILLGGLGAYPGFVHVDIRDGGRLVRWTGRRARAEVV